MAKDFRIKQLRTSQVIVSGSSVGASPSLLVYSSSAATNVDGGTAAGLLTGVGTDVWAFVSGSTAAGDPAHDATVLFGGNVVISGSLGVSSFSVTSLNSPTDSPLTLSADTNLIFKVDEDNDGNNSFQFVNGADVEVVNIDEAGNLQIDGDLTVTGNDIKDSGNAAAITFDGSQNTTLAGNLTIPADIIHAGDTDTKIALAEDSVTITAGNVEMVRLTETDSGDATVFNNASANVDFQVKSPNLSAAIYVNSGQDSIVVGENSTADLAQDTKIIFGGTPGSKNTATRGTSVFKGDLVVSGTLFAEKQVMEVDLSQRGHLVMSGAIHLEDLGPGGGGGSLSVPQLDAAIFANTGSFYVKQTDGSGTSTEVKLGQKIVGGSGLSSNVSGNTTTLSTDNTKVAHLTGSEFSGNVGVTGSLGVVGDISLAAEDYLYLNGLNGDVKLRGYADALDIDGDDNLRLYSDTSTLFVAGTNRTNLSGTTSEFNTNNEDVDFEVNTNNYNATLLIDGNDDSIILGHEGFSATPAAIEAEGYGKDVKIMISGSAGSKSDTAANGRGVVVMPGDVVVSGSLVDGTGASYIKNAGNGVANNAGTAELNLNTVGSSATVAVGDSIAFIDADDSNSTKKGTIADLVTAIAGDGLANVANQLQVGVDNASIERNSDALRVKALGITDGMLAGSISNSKLSNDSVTITAGDGLKTGGSVALGSSVTLDVDVGDFAGTGLEASGDDLRIASSAAGDGLTGGGGSALAVNAGSGISLVSGQVRADTTVVAALAGATFSGALQADNDLLVAEDIKHVGDSDTKITFTEDKVTLTAGSINALEVQEDSANSAVVVNQSGNADLDFRVESTNEEKMIYVNSGLDYISIGEDSGVNMDTHLFVSGAIGGIESQFGVAVFGGDLVVSGTIYDASHSPISLKSLKENGTFTTPPVATSTNSIAIGNDAAAQTGAGAFAIGNKTRASGTNSIALGSATGNNTASGISAVALGGENVTASGNYSATLGGQNNTASGPYSVVVGRDSSAAGDDAIAIGKDLVATENNSIVLGNNANGAKIAVSGSLEVFNSTFFDGDVTLQNGRDLIVPTFIKHLSDLNTSIQFNNDRIRFNTNGITRSDFTSTQVLIMSGGASGDTDPAAGQDVSFMVSGSLGSRGTTTRGTALFSGDVHISGSLSGPTAYELTDSTVRLFRDGTTLKFDDGENTVKTLSQLASTGASTDHFAGVHGADASTAKLKATGSVAFAGDLDNFVDGLQASGVGRDVFVFFSGSAGSKNTTTRGLTLFGGDSVFSGSAHYLGSVNFNDIDATGNITAGGILKAGGNQISNSNDNTSIKLNSSDSGVLFGARPANTTAQSFVDVTKDDDTVIGTTNTFTNYNMVMRNHSSTTNAFAGIAFEIENSDTPTTNNIGASVAAVRVGAEDTDLVLSTNTTGDDGLSEAVRIRHDGKVGIGVSTPSRALDVNGDIHIRGGDVLFANSQNATLSFADASGTDTAGRDITIHGGTSTGNAAGGSINFNLAQAGGSSGTSVNAASTTILSLSPVDGAATFAGNIKLPNNDGIKNADGNTVLTVRGNSDGNGIQIPGGDLELNQSGTATIIIGDNSDGNDRSISFGHSTLQTRLGIDDSADVFAINTDQNFETGNDFEIDASGNVTLGNGDLYVRGGDIYGIEDGQLRLHSDTDVIVKLDADGDSTSSFKINVSGDTPKFEVNESGDTQMDGVLTVDGTGNSSIASDNLDISEAIRHIGDTNTQMKFLSAGQKITFETNLGGMFLINGTAGESVFNEGGASIDFRVEGDNDQNLIFADASTDRVGIGTGTPATELHIKGDLTVEDGSSSDTIGKLYASSDDGVLDLYANGSVKLSLKANGESSFDQGVRSLSYAGAEGGHSLMLSNGTYSDDNQYLKIASCTFGANSLATAHATILLVESGRKQDGQNFPQGSRAVTINVSNESDGGTSPLFTVDFAHSDGDLSDPEWRPEDFTLTYNTSAKTAEIWVKAPSLNSFNADGAFFATMLAGSNEEDEAANGSGSYYTGYWKLLTNQAWANSITSLGADVNATHSSRQFELVTTNNLSVTGETGSGCATFVGNTNSATPLVKIESTDTGMTTNQALLEIDTGDSTMISSNYFIEFTNNGTILGSVNSEVAYTTFTGQHPTQLAGSDIPAEGSILKSTGEVIFRDGLSNAWVRTAVTAAEKDKAVVGVYRGEWSTKTHLEGTVYVYNAIGEGQILVTDAGGNIEAGDYICSSTRPGHGIKQDDDILHNYTVAKATEAVDWSTVAVDPVLGFKSKLVACTYHCG